MITQLHNEEEVLQGLSRGNQADFNTVYNTFNGTVFNTAMMYVRDPVEAQEIVQQVFVKLWERRAVFSEVHNLKDYLFISTKNAIFNFFNQLEKQARITNTFADHTHTSIPETAFEERQYHDYWLQVIEELPTQQKQVYKMIEIQDNTLDEVTDKLNLSKATVKNTLNWQEEQCVCT